MADATIRVKTKVDNADLEKFGSNFVSQGKQWGSIIGNVSSALGKLTLKLGAVGLLVKGISALVNMTKEGFKNLAQTGGEYNKVMSDFKSQTEQLKNALATAFEPIVVTIIPYLTKLCEWLTTAADYTAQFLAVISGKTSYQRAKKQTVDYASTLKKTTSEAKKALATFDQLNVLTSNSGTSSGGAATGANAFETVDLEGWDGLKNVIDNVQDAYDKIKRFNEEAVKPCIDVFENGLYESSLIAAEGFMELCYAADDFINGDYEGALQHMNNALDAWCIAWDNLAVTYVASFGIILGKLNEIFGVPIPSWLKKMLGIESTGTYDNYWNPSSTENTVMKYRASQANQSNARSLLYGNLSTTSSTGNTKLDSINNTLSNIVSTANGGNGDISLNINLDGDVVYNSVVTRQEANSKSKGGGHSF